MLRPEQAALWNNAAALPRLEELELTGRIIIRAGQPLLLSKALLTCLMSKAQVADQCSWEVTVVRLQPR